MSGAKHRRKGDRVEREIVQLLRDSGIWAERVPLSGATHYRGADNDIDVYVYGRDYAPDQCQVKARKDGKGFALIERWLEESDFLITKANNRDPIVHINIFQFMDYLLSVRRRLASLSSTALPDRLPQTRTRLQDNPAKKGESPWPRQGNEQRLVGTSEKAGRTGADTGGDNGSG